LSEHEYQAAKSKFEKKSTCGDLFVPPREFEPRSVHEDALPVKKRDCPFLFPTKSRAANERLIIETAIIFFGKN
jgi:hypothetical protein